MPPPPPQAPPKGGGSGSADEYATEKDTVSAERDALSKGAATPDPEEEEGGEGTPPRRVSPGEGASREEDGSVPGGDGARDSGGWRELMGRDLLMNVDGAAAAPDAGEWRGRRGQRRVMPSGEDARRRPHQCDGQTDCVAGRGG